MEGCLYLPKKAERLTLISPTENSSNDNAKIPQPSRYNFLNSPKWMLTPESLTQRAVTMISLSLADTQATTARSSAKQCLPIVALELVSSEEDSREPLCPAPQ